MQDNNNNIMLVELVNKLIESNLKAARKVDLEDQIDQIRLDLGYNSKVRQVFPMWGVAFRSLLDSLGKVFVHSWKLV